MAFYYLCQLSEIKNFFFFLNNARIVRKRISKRRKKIEEM